MIEPSNKIEITNIIVGTLANISFLSPHFGITGIKYICELIISI